MLVVIARIVDRPAEVNDPRLSAMAHLSWKHNGRDVLSPASGSRESERFTMVSRRFAMSTSRLKTGSGGEEDGLRIALATLTVGRLTLPAACLGGLKQCLSLMRWWGQSRVQWNRPIGEHNLIGEKLCRVAAIPWRWKP